MTRPVLLIVANVVMTTAAAVGTAVALLPMVTADPDVTSALTPGQAPTRAPLVVAMTSDDHARFPGCQDMRTWPKGKLAERVLVVRSNGDRDVIPISAAFSMVEASRTDPARAVWVIGACPTQETR